jgi:hypothetical protein
MTWRLLTVIKLGATNQILLFAMLAVKVKQNAPGCHTYLEVVNVSSLAGRRSLTLEYNLYLGSIWQICPHRLFVFRFGHQYHRGLTVVVGRQRSCKCAYRHECLCGCDIDPPWVSVRLISWNLSLTKTLQSVLQSTLF